MATASQPVPELPRYQCHKIVCAAKILMVIRSEGKVSLDLDGIGAVEVSADFDAKHHPTHGGYFVIYEGGYQSFSPGKAFEEGYTRIEPKTVLDARKMCPPGSEPLA